MTHREVPAPTLLYTVWVYTGIIWIIVIVKALGAIALSLTISTNHQCTMLTLLHFSTQRRLYTQPLRALSYSHTHTVAFSRKHNEDSSELQLLQLVKLPDLYRRAKHRFQFKFRGNFSITTSTWIGRDESYYLETVQCRGKQLSKHHYPHSAIHLYYIHWG